MNRMATYAGMLMSLILGNVMSSVAAVNPQAESYISIMLNKQLPYTVNILDVTFNITSTTVYPPGKLTKMFAIYILEKELIKGKIIADVGAGCFALGIIVAKHGAKKVIGTDINEAAITCAQNNIALNNVQNNTLLFHGDALEPLLLKFKGKIDIILSGPPWDTISLTEYNGIEPERKPISRAFYDVEDKLLSDVLSNGHLLLSLQGKIFITASARVMDRIKKLCARYRMNYNIVKEEDLHQDGNTHYILEITRAT